MRKFIVAGNWKMFGSQQSVNALLSDILSGYSEFDGQMIIFPSVIHIPLAHEVLKGSPIALGAQNAYFEKEGAFTGETSPEMVANFGCDYLLIGHSERRQLFGDDSLVASKVEAAVRAGLKPVICVGETLEQRESHQTEAVINKQLKDVIDKTGVEILRQSIIAYEPVWAIGTGKTAAREQAQAVHAHIRAFVASYNDAIAKDLSIIYGGSVKPENAEGIFAMPDVDGALVGGASLKASSFLAICSAREKICTN